MFRTRRLARLIVLATAVGVPVPAAAVYLKSRASDVVSSAQTVPIVRHVDGDTIIAIVHGKPERVRLIGLDSPETKKPGAPIGCGGPEASANAKRWVRAHPRVRLRTDPATPNRDRYGRLLRYVEPVGKGRDLSTVQVAAGHARVAAYGQRISKLSALKSAQRRSQNARRGLWGHCS